MAQKTEEKKIAGHTYIVTQLGALKGRTLLIVLTRMIGPVMSGLLRGGAIGTTGKVKAPASIDAWGDSIAGALKAWSESASEKDFGLLCDEFATMSKVRIQTTNAPIELELGKVFDSHFAGQYGEMLLWLAFAIQVNYASFLSEMASEASSKLAGLGIQKTPSG